MKKLIFLISYFLLLFSLLAKSQTLNTNKKIYKAKEKVIISYSYPKNFNTVFVFVTPITGTANYSSNTFDANPGQEIIDDGRFGPGEYEVTLINSPSYDKTVLAKTKFTVVGPCKTGEKSDCILNWESLKCVPVNSGSAPVTSTKAYTQILKKVMDFLNDKGVSPKTVVFGGAATTGIAAWFKDKIKEAVKDPKKVLGEIWAKVKINAVAASEASIAAGLAPVLSYTVAAAMVDIEFLDAVFQKMVNEKYGVQLSIDAEYKECVWHVIGENTMEKKTKKGVIFGPLDPASGGSLTAMTFNTADIDNLLRLPLLKSLKSRLKTLAKNNDEIAKAGMTPKDVDDELKKVNGKIAEAEAKVAEFKELYKNKICNEAKKDEH